MSRNHLLRLTGDRAEFDLVRFLKAHKKVLDITDELAEKVSDTLRMTQTSDLVYIKDKSYLKPLTFLKPTQMAVGAGSTTRSGVYSKCLKTAI
jgi:hypothetical protein